MKYLLAIESSSKQLSVALFAEDNLIEEIILEPNGTSHSERLHPLIHQILTHHGATLRDVESIAVAGGPGSFTSLRVGMSTALGLAVSLKISMSRVSTLKSMALDFDERTVATYMLAGRGRVYAAVYQKGKVLVEEGCYDVPDFLNRVEQLGTSSILLAGPYLDPDLFMGTSFERVIHNAHAAMVGRLALSENLASCDYAQMDLLYLQEPDFGKK